MDLAYFSVWNLVDSRNSAINDELPPSLLKIVDDLYGKILSYAKRKSILLVQAAPVDEQTDYSVWLKS